MMSQVKLLIMLILVVPATSVCAERSFSALRRVESYLRATMNQGRLTHVVVLHVHKDRAQILEMNELLQEFISRTAERRSVFATPTNV